MPLVSVDKDQTAGDSGRLVPRNEIEYATEIKWSNELKENARNFSLIQEDTLDVQFLLNTYYKTIAS